jgi:hypothetical protein
MRILATSFLVFALVPAVAIASAGCDDPSLITVEAPDGSGVPVAEAGAEGGGFDLAACEACFMAPDTPGPGCATEWAGCHALSDCDADFTCIEAAGCFGRPLASFITCGSTACSSSGLASGTPGYTAIVNLFECITMNACTKACFTQ